MHNFFLNDLKVALWCSTNMIVLSKQAENQDPFKLINPSFLFSILWPTCHSHPIHVSQSIQTMNYIRVGGSILELLVHLIESFT